MSQGCFLRCSDERRQTNGGKQQAQQNGNPATVSAKKAEKVIITSESFPRCSQKTLHCALHLLLEHQEARHCMGTEAAYTPSQDKGVLLLLLDLVVVAIHVQCMAGVVEGRLPRPPQKDQRSFPTHHSLMRILSVQAWALFRLDSTRLQAYESARRSRKLSSGTLPIMPSWLAIRLPVTPRPRKDMHIDLPAHRAEQGVSHHSPLLAAAAASPALRCRSREEPMRCGCGAWRPS